METLAIDYMLWHEGEYVVAQCLNVEISSFGETRDEAVGNLKDAVRLYLQDDDGIPTEEKLAHFRERTAFAFGHESLVS